MPDDKKSKEADRRKAVNDTLRDVPAPGAIATQPIGNVNRALGRLIRKKFMQDGKK